MLLSVERPNRGSLCFSHTKGHVAALYGLVRAVLPASVWNMADGLLRFPRNLGESHFFLLLGNSRLEIPGRISDCSTNPPTDPDVRISLIRFLGAARFHTARMPLDAASRIIRLRPLTKAFGYRHVFTMTCSPSCPNHGRSVGAEGRTP